MKLNMTEMESSLGQDPNYTPEPSWWDQATAAKDQTVANGLTISSMIYSGDALRGQLDEMITEDPDNQLGYEAMKEISGKNLDLYEHYYNEGTLEHFTNKRDSVNADVLNNYFTKVKTMGKYDAEGLYNVGKGYAAKDYYEAQQTLDAGDSWTAPLVGGMAGAMMDPVNIALLPAGGAVLKGAGSTIATAGKAAMQEMGIATAAEALIQPKMISWNEEIGVKYGVKEAATNAALSIGAAGLLRGTGSAMYDLTADGVKALRTVDPKLASDYEHINRKNISSNTSEHLDNLSRVELGQDPVIKEPGEVALSLKNGPPAKEFVDTPELETPLVDYDGELEIVTGRTVDGEATFSSYRELDEALDDDLARIKAIEDCILKGN